MFPLILSLLSLLPLATPTNITQTRLPNIQSGVAIVYENNSTVINITIQTTYTIPYSKSHPTPPQPFYFLNRYKMKDRFLYENFYSYIKTANVDNWQLTVQPVSTTSVLVLSVSYIAVQNIYENFFVKEYTYGVQFIGRTLSSNSSQNKLISSWVGFWHTNSLSAVLDINVNSYFSNTSFYSITISSSTNSGDWWNRTNVMVCIINMQKFPSVVRVLSGTVVLSSSNTITSWTEFQKFANVSYCFGYSGINANANETQDMHWTEQNGPAIKAQLSFLNYGRYSYVIIWNETVIAEQFFYQSSPVTPVTPVTPVIPVEPTNPSNNSNNNTNPTPIAPVDPIVDPTPKPNPTPNPNSTQNTNNLTKLQDKQQSSNSPIGIIIGVVVGVLVIGAIVVFLIFKFRHSKGKRVPIPQNQKEFQIFTPSFV